jgi:hypothetical protein
VVTQTGITNAIVSWTPGEEYGPGTNRLIVGVTDVVNGTAFLGTDSFLVIVNESNQPPVMPVQADQTVDELSLISVPIIASDADRPTNALRFALLSGPTNASLSQDGLFTWTPTEEQGPGAYLFVMSVTDTNPVAINQKSFSATNTMTVTVREVNSPPSLASPSNYTSNPGQAIQFNAAATDPDVPPNLLAFDLVNPPPGASISSSGLFSWRPSVSLANTTNVIQIRVVDDAAPGASDAKSFQIVLTSLLPVVLTPLGPSNGVFHFRVNGTAGPDYVIMTSSNLTQWSDLATNYAPSIPFEFSDPNYVTNSHLYRVRLSP